MKTIFITGVSSGIGESLAYVYAREKYTVGICARRIGALNKIADKCKEFGGKIFVYKLDVQNQEKCNLIAKKFLANNIKNFKNFELIILNPERNPEGDSYYVMPDYVSKGESNE